MASSSGVDHTSVTLSQFNVYVADSDTGDIWSLDDVACHCRLVVNATALSLAPSDIGMHTLDYCNSVTTTPSFNGRFLGVSVGGIGSLSLLVS